MELIHGGDVAGYALRYGRPPLDFSASLNPFGTPPGVVAAARRAAAESFAYPDPLCRSLSAALAARLRVPEPSLWIGNGAADVIFRAALAAKPRNALVPAPVFAEYERALRLVGCGMVRHYLKRDDLFDLNADLIGKIVPGVDLVVLCQPGNPTGRLIEPSLLDDIARRCREVGALLLVDECFCDFVEEPERWSLLRRAGGEKGLFVVGSFTKLYGMAGMRLGYGVCGDQALLDGVRGAGQPWSVSTIAQAAGLAALDEDAYLRESLEHIRAEKRRLAECFRLRGLDVIGDAANYLFFRAADVSLDRRLMEKGILIRSCANFHGLEPGYFRVAVRLRGENDRLLRAIDEIHGKG